MQKIHNNVFKLSNPEKEQKGPQVFTITSGKGGVGKTNLSVNIAIALRQMKKRVLLFDADMHLGNIDLFLGLRPKFTISDVVQEGKEIDQVICKGPGDIDILPASSAVVDLLEAENEIVRQLNQSFAKSKREYDFIIVDSGAGLSRNVLPFVLGADKVLIAVTRDPASIADAYGMIKIVKMYKPAMPFLFVANMVSDIEEGESIFRKMRLMVERFCNSNIAYGGSLLEAVLIKKTIRQQKALLLEHPTSDAARTIKIITKNLYSLPSDVQKSQNSFFQRFISNRNVALGVEK